MTSPLNANSSDTPLLKIFVEPMKRFAVSRHSPANTEALDHRERNRNGGHDENSGTKRRQGRRDFGYRKAVSGRGDEGNLKLLPSSKHSQFYRFFPLPLGEG